MAGDPAIRNDKRYTYADYCTWGDAERWEVIDGVAYAMSPSPSVDHQEIALGIAEQLRAALRGQKCRAFIAPLDVLLPQRNEADELVETTVQPDVFVVCDPAKIRDKNVRGTPDFIVEVLSPKKPGRDVVLKRRRYERAGVPEYWVVHPRHRVVLIFRTLADGHMTMDAQELSGQTAVAVLPGVSIDWDPIVAGLPPEPE